MALLPPLDDEALGPEAREVFADIRKVRNTDFVSRFWRVLAHDPPTLVRTWHAAKDVMAPGALDPLTKELVYIAVSVTNNCEYCIHTHTAAARAKGMTEAQFRELIAVVALASQTNRIAIGYQIDVDERFREPLA
jgi:AhpD family alkylhydroperoxidase